MHIVINHLHLDIPVEELVPQLQKDAVPLIAAQPGFVGVYFTKEAEDRGTVIILWHSLEDAKNGAAVMGPTWFAQNVAPHLASDQVRSVEEVLVAYP